MVRRHAKSGPADARSAATAGMWPYAVPLALVWLVGFGINFAITPLQNNAQFDRLTIALLFPEVSALLGEAEGIASGVSFLPQRFDLVAVAGLIVAGAWGIGGLCWRLLALCDRNRALAELTGLERLVCSIGLGLSMWSLLTLAFGLIACLSQAVFICVLAGSFAAELLLTILRKRPATSRTNQELDPPSLKSVSLFVAVVAPFLLLAILAAMLPPFDFDVKEYHLGGPKEWFLDGRVHFLPHNVYTSFPALTEMLSLSAMVVRGDWYRGALAGQLVLSGFLPLTALAIYVAGRRLFGETAGLCGAAIYATTPWAYRISVIAYAEGGLTCYLILSTFTAIIAIPRIRSGQPALILVVMSGLFAGSAMACKYPGVVQVVIPIGIALTAAVCWRGQRGGVAEERPSDRDHFALRRVACIAAVYSFGVFLTVGPWLLKNTVETGNPVYPLLWSVFDGRDWNEELNAKWEAAHSPAHHQPASFFKEIAGIAVANDWQSMLVFGFTPLAFLATRRRQAAAIAAYLLYLYVAWWTLTHRIDRFWVPMLPVACLLAGAGAAWAEGLPSRLANPLDGAALRRLWRFGSLSIALLAVLFNLGFVTTPLAGNPSYLANLEAAARSVTTPSFALLNNELPEGSKVLLVGEAEIFDARIPVVYNTVFDQNIFEEWTASRQVDASPESWPLRPTEEIRQTFEDHHITHVFVNWREVLRYRTTYGFSPFVSPVRFEALVDAGLLAPPQRLYRTAYGSLDQAQQELAGKSFARLIEGSGDDRTFASGELYRVLAAPER